jgi:ActR/RegA family two-component response regulator
MAETVILIVDDLMFAPRLEKTLQTQGYQPIAATNHADLTRALFTAPVLAIVDLFSRSFEWEPLVRSIKGPGKKAAHVPVIGFGPHVDLELRERALAAGCETVVGRSAIVDQLAHLLQKYKWVVDTNRCQEAPPPLVRQGLELFNQGNFYDCHEVIEDAWMAEKDPIRVMYQGILQIGVACYHIQNRNWRGAIKVLERGVPKAARFAPTCMGINIARLLQDSEAIRQELARLGPGWEGEFDERLFPTIEYHEI